MAAGLRPGKLAMSDERRLQVSVRAQTPARARPGDIVEVHGHRVGEAHRLGEILEVIGEPDHAHYRVRWEDDHESLFYPSNDATVTHVVRRRAKEQR